MELSLYNAQEGLYWARYKDHGWRPLWITVAPSDSGFKKVLDLYYDDYIPTEEYGKYTDLREIKEPRMYE